MKKKKRQGRVLLPNGCSFSYPNVFPSNWKTVSASTKKEWYITYRYYDPLITDISGKVKPKPCQVKGMNEYKDLKQRQNATQIILTELLEQLEHRGYNPITNTHVENLSAPDYIISPDSKVTDALSEAVQKMKAEYSKDDYINLKSVVKYVNAAIYRLRLE